MPQNKTPIHQFADSLTEFRHWLQGEGLSKKTVKNYVSDVHLWTEWALSQEDTSQAELLNVENYRQSLEENGTPTSTVHRHLASLRRYAEFLTQKHPSWMQPSVPENSEAPIRHEVAKKKIIEHFGLALRADNCKETSVKNYLTDIKIFGDSFPDQSFDEICRKPKIAWYLAEERKRGLTQNTLKRKEASIKRFCRWAVKEEFISQNPYETWIEKKKQQLAETFTPLAWFEKRKTPASVPSAPATDATHTASAGATTVRSGLMGWYEQYHSWRLSSYLHLGVLVIFAVMIGLFGYQQFYLNVQQQFAYPSEPTRPGRILSFQGRLTDSGRTPITTPINFEFRLYDAESSGNELWDSADSGTCSIDPDQDGIFSVLLGDSVNGCGNEITENVFTENDEVWLEVQVSSETLSPRQRIATVPYALNSETVQGFPVSLDGDINTIPVINALGEIIIGANNPSLIASSGAFLIQGESLLFQTETGSDGDISFQPDGEGSVQILSSTTTNDSLFISNSNLTTGNLIRGEVGNDSTTYNLISLASGSSSDDKFVVDALGNTTIDGYLAAPGATISSTYSGNIPLTVNGTGGETLTLNDAGQLALATQGSSGGLVIGGDTNLYRSGSDVLATDDSLSVGDDLTVTNNIQATLIALGGISPQTYNAISDSGTASFASTDNDLFIEDILEVGGQLYVNGQEVTPSQQFWQENSNVLSPANSTWDLAIGGTATSSAVAQIFALGSDAGYLQARGATLSSEIAARTALTVQGASGQTANLTNWKDSSGSNLAFIDASGNLAVNQNIGSTGDTDLLQLTSNLLTVNGDLTTTGDLNVNGDDINSDGNLRITPTGTLTLNSTGNMTLDSSGDIILDAGGADLLFRDDGVDVATFSNLSTDLFLDIVGDDFIIPDRVMIGQTSAGTSLLTVQGAATGKALAIFDEEGDQNILSASASGTTVAYLDRTGNLFIEGAIADLSGNTLLVNDNLNVAGDLQVQGNDISDSGGVAITFDGSQNITTYGTLTLPNSNTLTGVANFLQVSNGLSVGGNTTYYIDENGNANLNGITGAGLLTMNNSGTHRIAGTLSLDGGTLTRTSGGLTLTTTSDGDIAATAAGEITLRDGRVDYAIPLSLSDTNLDIFDPSDRAIVDALNYLYNNLGSGGGGGFDGYWQRTTAGLLSPNQAYESIAVGGNSTASAVFHVNAITGDVSLDGDIIMGNGVVFDNSVSNTLQITASTALDIDAAIIDLSTQSVDVSLASSTVDALNFASNLLSLDTQNNRIGVGTASPAHRLHLNSTTEDQAILVGASTAFDSSLYLYSTDYGIRRPASTGTLQFMSGGRFTWLTSGLERMRIENTGNVGIHNGTVSPAHRFQVVGGYAGNALVMLNDTFGNDIFTASSSGTTRFTLGANGLITLANGATIDNTSDGTLALTEPTIQLVGSTSLDIDTPTIDLSTQTVDVTLNSAVDALNFGSNLLSLDTSNNYVGIGTAAPGEKLHIVDGGGGAQIRIGDYGSGTAFGAVGFGSSLSSTSFSLAGNGTNTYLNTPTGGSIHFQEAGNTLMLLTDDGYLRVGSSTAPTARLSLYQDGGLTPQENGIAWSNDTNLFRSSANVLKTEDRFVSTVGLVIDADSDALPTDVELYVDGDISLSQLLRLGNYAGDPGSDIGTGSLAYDSNDNVVKYFDGSNWVELTGEAATNWYFNETDATIYPRNVHSDLLIGGASTASAKFHVNSTTGDVFGARAATFSGSIVAGGQIQVGQFGTDPTAIGSGSMYYNSSDNQLYLFDGTQWTALSTAAGGVWYLDAADGVIRPSNINPDILLGGYSTDSAKLKFSQATGAITIGDGKHEIYESNEPITGNDHLKITSTGDYLYVEPDLRVGGGDIYKQYAGDVIISLDEDFNETRFSGLVNATDNLKVYTIGSQDGEIYTQDTGSLNKIWTTSADFNSSGAEFDFGLENPATNDELRITGTEGGLASNEWITNADFDAGSGTSGIQDPASEDELALEPTQTDWVYRAWNYRTDFDITYTGGETLQEYQVLIDNFDTAALITAGKMNADCSDLRFSDDGGNELSFYIVENTCDTTDTEVWVKTNSFDSGGETIYAYYDNDNAASASSITETFSYSSQKTVGYIVLDTMAANTVDVFSMMDDNSITVGSASPLNLDYFEEGSVTSGFMTTASSVQAKGLFQLDADVNGAESFVPVSYAGTDFAWYESEANMTACIMSPWGNANVHLYDNGVLDSTLTVNSGTTNCTQYNTIDGPTNVRVASDIPILLVSNSNGTSNYRSLVHRPLTKNEYLYGVGSTPYYVTGSESSTNGITYDTSSGGNGTVSLAANSYNSMKAGVSFGAAPAYRIIATDASISAYQIGDGSGGDGSSWMERKELSTVYGSRNAARNVAVSAPYPDTTCSVYATEGSAFATVVGGSNTDVNHIGFNTGNNTSYLGDTWTLECDKPVMAYYNGTDANDEFTLTGYVQMRQFTYPTPTVAENSEEQVNFTSGDQTWTSNVFDSGGAGNFQLQELLVNWTLDGSDNNPPQFQIQASDTGAFAGEETVYPAAGQYYVDGGTYDINDGVARDVTTEVLNSFQYWRVLVVLNTGATTTDTPTIQDITITGGVAFQAGEQQWTSNYVVSGTGHQTANLQFGQPNRFKATWELDGSDNIAPKFELLVSTTPNFDSAIILPDGPGTYFQDGGTYDINNGEELDITSYVAAAAGTMNNWANSKYYWKVRATIDSGSDRTDTPLIYDMQLRNHRPLVLQKYGHDVGIGIEDTEATLHVEATNSGDVFKLTNEGEQLLKVDNEGNVTFGSSTNNDVKLTVHGDIFSPDETRLHSDVNNIQGTYLYDTTLDRDGGAWRKSSIARTLSWYNEGKDDGIADNCSTSTDDRCGSNQFPAKANIVLTTDAVYIFDVSTNTMWMKFEQGSGRALGATSNNTPTSAVARDGRLFIGMAGTSSETGIYEIDFTTDTMAYWNTSGRSESNNTIAMRNDNDNVFSTNTRTMFALTNSKINDLDLTLREGMRYLAAATEGGINLINLDQPLDYVWEPISSDLNGDTITDDGNNGNAGTNLFDYNGTTLARSNAADDTFIITYQFNSGAKNIQRYRLRSEDGIISSEAPSDWTFEGSNNGSTWTTLDTVVDNPWIDTGSFTNWYVKEVNSAGNTYSYYRLNITDNVNAGADQVWLNDLVFEVKKEKSAVTLLGSDLANQKQRTSSEYNATTMSRRHINDFRRTNVNGEYVSATSGHDLYPWLEINLTAPTVVSTYSITNANDLNGYPTDWTLYASNDQKNWVTLDSQTGQTFSTYNYKPYSFTNSTAYQYYRLVVTNNGGETAYTEIGDFQVGTPIITASGSNNDTTQDETNLIFDDAGASGYYWISNSHCTGGVCDAWVRYDYGANSKRTIKSYAVKGYVTSGREIRNWSLQACGDVSEDCSSASGNWDTLDTQANGSNPFSSTDDILTYTFSNSTAYQYYRLRITGNGGNAFIDLRGFWLLGAEDRVYSESQNGDTSNSPYYAIDRGDHGSYVSLVESNGDGLWIEKSFSAGVAQTITGVRWEGDDATDSLGPRDWTIYGSNDRITWTALESYDGRPQIGTAHFANNTAYQFYRFTVDANNGGTQMRINELYLIGGRYHNVRFSGSSIVATNGSQGTVEIFYDIWERLQPDDNTAITGSVLHLRTYLNSSLADGSLDGDSGPFVAGATNTFELTPRLTGAPEYATKPALEVDGGEIYFGHRYGTDLLLTVRSPDPDGNTDAAAKLRASYGATQSASLATEFGLNFYFPFEEDTFASAVTNYGLAGGISHPLSIGCSSCIPTSTPSGKLGRGMAFTRSEGDYIRYPDAYIGELDHRLGDDFALGGWVYPDAANAGQNRPIMGTYRAYSCGAGTCAEGWYIGVRTNNNFYMAFCPNTENGGCATTEFNTAPVPAEQWTHIVVQKREGVNELYLNGKLVETFSIGGVLDGSDLVFGAAGISALSNGWDGRLDEMFIKHNSLTPTQIRTLYERGSGDYRVSQENADIASITSLGHSSLNVPVNRFRGFILELTGGTGAGQTRLITKNSATTFTVSPAWDTVPDTTTDFRIRPYALPGSTQLTKAIRPQQNDIFLGLNNGANGGGVVRIDKKTGYVTDYYHGNAGKTDDTGTSWGTTTGYDNIVGIETTQDNLIIASDTLYWREKIGDTLFETIDKLQQALTGTLFTTHTQDDTGASRRDSTQQVLRKGWSWIEQDDTSRAVKYGISYNEAPLVFITQAGVVRTAGNNPSSLTDCSDEIIGYNDVLSVANIRHDQFTIMEAVTNEQHCFTWMSIGNYDAPMPEGSFDGGADLAEWYGTDDTSLKAGEVVSIDPSGDIKVIRSGRPQDPSALGIIATQPSITLGTDSGLTPGYVNDPQLSRGAKSAVQVALAGRVPVKVSLENGPIKPGDYLTTSSTPGVAAKAITAGPTIGKAMEAFDGTSTIVGIAGADAKLSPELMAKAATMSAKPGESIASSSATMAELEKAAFAELNQGIGTVMAFVNTSYFDPAFDSTQSASNSQTGEGSFAIDSSGKLVGLGAYSFDIVDAIRDAYQQPLNLALSEFGDIPDDVSTKSSQLADRESILDAALGRLKTLGTLALSELNVANARVLDTLFARNIKTDELASQLTKTNLIKPLQDADVIVEIGQEGASESGQFAIFNNQGEQLATIDNSGLRTKKAVINDLENRYITVSDLLNVTGDASISGELSANSARIAQLQSTDATISGTLYASDIRGNISSESINGLEDRVRAIVSRERAELATPSATVPEENEVRSLIAQLLAEHQTNTADEPDTTTDEFGTIDTTPDQSVQNNSTTVADAWSINQDVAIDGIITAQSLALNSALTINGSSLSAQEFTFSGETFAFQPSGFGRLSLMADALVITTDGGVEINADLRLNGRTTFANDVVSEKSLFATLLQPLPNNNIEVQLASANALNTPENPDNLEGEEFEPTITPSEFILRGEDNQEIAAFSASGSSRFRRLVIAAENASTDEENEEVATSVVTNATTGTGAIPAGQTKFVVRNTTISANSLIYLTPTSSTKNKVMYVGAKAGEDPETEENEGYFEVVLDGVVNEDVTFNWWIIN